MIEKHVTKRTRRSSRNGQPRAQRDTQLLLPGKIFLSSSAFAKSAYDNEISMYEFNVSLDNFSNQSLSKPPVVLRWRGEAIDKFFALLKRGGKLKAEDFLGGSDYGNNEDDPS